MLTALHVRDFALVSSAEAELRGGFCVLTGETGAGKSMLVDAIQAACGSRETRPPAEGAARADVTAEFALAPGGAAARWLEENALDDPDSGRVIVRRTVEGGGKRRTRSFVNGKPATLAQVRELASLLVEIHGQHESLRLLEPGRQRDLLDRHAGSAGLRSRVRGEHEELCALRRRRAELAAAGARLREEAETLRLRIEELERIGFSAGKWRDADAQLRRIHHFGEISDGLSEIVAHLSGEEGVRERLGAAHRAASAIAKRDERAGSLLLSLGQLAELADEVARDAGSLSEGIGGDRGDAAALESFISESHRLMRLHGCVSADALEEKMREMAARLGQIGGVEDPERLDGQIAALQGGLEKSAAALTKKRKAAAKALSAEISGALGALGMAGGTFLVDLADRGEIGPDGREQVRFLISTHRGTKPGELREVASGGELSRVGLAVMAKVGGEAEGRTLVFDEVDSGIGGEIATVVGRVLKDLAARCGQVLCVTHLPQIASLADEHWSVGIDRGAETAQVRLSRLEGAARQAEVARMLGGEEVGSTARRHADQLLELGRRAPKRARASRG